MIVFNSGPVLAAGISTSQSPFLAGWSASLADAETTDSWVASSSYPILAPAPHTASKRRKSGDNVPCTAATQHSLPPAVSSRPESCLPPSMPARQSSSNIAADWHEEGLLASQFPTQGYLYPDFDANPHSNPQSDETIVASGTSGWYPSLEEVISPSSGRHSDWHQSESLSDNTWTSAIADFQSASSDVWPTDAHVCTARYVVGMSASASPSYASDRDQAQEDLPFASKRARLTHAR
jgi:hypothetical protein